MKLLEFFYFNDTVSDFVDDSRYDADKDKSVLKSNDTRKVRLTLKQINMLRKQSEAHEQEKQRDLSLIQQMYAAPPAEAPPV